MEQGFAKLARELEERDGRVAAELAGVRQLQAEAEELRTHAEAIDAIRSAYPFEHSRLTEATAAARTELTEREAAHAAAEQALARAQEGEELAAARRRATRAADAAASSRRKLERLEGELDELEREAARAREALPRLEHRATELDARLASRPRVTTIAAEPADLAGVLEWAARARAALFVAAGGLETERERIVREANELGAAALGEPALATSVTLVRERIEQAAGR